MSAVLKTDKSAEVRRAAVLVITLILRGLGKNIMEVSLFNKQSEDLIFFSQSGDIIGMTFPTLINYWGPCVILCIVALAE